MTTAHPLREPGREAERVPPGPAAGGVALAASLAVLAFNLRAPVTSVGPVLPDIVRATGLSVAAASLLTTLPSLSFGLFGPLAPALGRRLGDERALLAALALLALGAGLRGLGPAPALFAGQVLACLGIALANVLLPGVVKRDLPGRGALATGLYVMSMTAGAAIAAGATAPLARAFGSWAAALAFWAAPGVVALLAWAPRARSGGGGAGRGGSAARGLWTDPLAWWVTLFMGLQASLAYVVFGWLAPVLRDRGLPPVEAGLVLSVSVVAQAAAALVAPALATRGGDQRAANVGLSVLCVVALLGCLYAPLGWLWVWAVALGVTQGGLFAIALTLLVLRAPDAATAARLSGMAQGVGYLLASAGPFAAGLLHARGGPDGVALLCVALGLGTAISGLGAGRAGHVLERG